VASRAGPLSGMQQPSTVNIFSGAHRLLGILHHSYRFMRVHLDLRPPTEICNFSGCGTVSVGLRILNSNLEDSGLRAIKYSVMGAKLFASLIGAPEMNPCL
jgi:hypothetical protein